MSCSAYFAARLLSRTARPACPSIGILPLKRFLTTHPEVSPEALAYLTMRSRTARTNSSCPVSKKCPAPATGT